MDNSQQIVSTDGATWSEQDSRPPSGAVLLPTLLRAAVPVALVTLAVFGVAHKYQEGQPTTYESTSRITLSASTPFTPITTSFSNSSPDRYVLNQADIITNADVLNRAAALLADGVPGSDLNSSVTAAPAGNNDSIVVRAEAADPALAARRADAVARAYADFTTEQVNQLAEQAVRAVATDPVQVQDVRARAVAYGDGVAVIQPAVAPSAPSTASPKFVAGLAAVAAFLLSAGLALSLRGLRRHTGPDDLAAAAGGPYLGKAPVRWFGSAAAPVQPGPADYAMALQGLRYRLGEGGRSVLLTAIGRDTSAASAVLGLAAADAAQGRSVVIVDATPDGHLLRRSGAPAPAVSLTDAWAAGDLDSALSTVPGLGAANGGRVRIARVARDGVLTAAGLREALAALTGSADLVLVDAGAAVRDATAFSLLGEVSGAVAVVRTHRSDKDLREFRRRVALAGGQCAGVLVTRRQWLPSFGADTSSAGPLAAPARPAPVGTRVVETGVGQTLPAAPGTSPIAVSEPSPAPDTTPRSGSTASTAPTASGGPTAAGERGDVTEPSVPAGRPS